MRAHLFASALLLASGALGTAHAGRLGNSPLEKCGVIASVNGKETSVVLPSLHVLESTSRPGPFVLPADAPQHVSAIQCGRRSIIPAENDYKVLKAGFPFFIVAPDGRVVVLELSDGRLQASTQDGEFTPVEIGEIQAYLNKAQEYFNASASDDNTKK
jgi:hypothetical protein